MSSVLSFTTSRQSPQLATYFTTNKNDKLSKFQNICGVIARTLKKKSRKETNLKFYKIMTVPVLL
jgi:hypothetical protein